MKNLRKIFITLLLFVVSPSGTTALVEKNECQKKEAPSKKKRRSRGFYFAVYCIACYAIYPFAFDPIKNQIIEQILKKFDEEFDKQFGAPQNKNNIFDWGVSSIQKHTQRNKLKEELLLKFDDTIKEIREKQPVILFLAPLFLPLIIPVYCFAFALNPDLF